MGTTTFKGIIIGAAAATALGAVMGYKLWRFRPAYAYVVKVVPITETIKTPHRVCKDVLAPPAALVGDRKRIAGTTISAALRNVPGNQIGAGTGRTLATVGGAAASGPLGTQVDQQFQNSDPRIVRQTRCKTRYDVERTVSGYQVTYRLNHRQGVARMNYDPGDRIPIQDGKLLLSRDPSG